MKLNSITLKSVFPALNLIKLSTGNKISEKIAAVFLKFLEKRFQGQLLLEAPPTLLKIPSGLWPAVAAASRIKSLGAIENEKLPPLPDEPFLYKYWTKINGQGFGSGADFLSEASALWRSTAEGIERHLWRTSDDFYRKKTTYATYGNLEKTALDIFSLAGFSAKDKEESAILSFDKNSPFGWLKAISLLSGKKIYCPVQLLSHHYSKLRVANLDNPQGSEALLRWPVSTGLATGRSLPEALTKGILEIIERDAIMITYLNKLSPPRINLDHLSEQDEDIKKILKSFRRCQLKVTLLLIPTDWPVFVALALVTDELGAAPALTVGASADFNIKNCLLDALTEALSLRLALKNDPVFFEKNFDPKNINREGRLFYWSRPENLPKINFLFQGETKKIELPDKKNFFEPSADEKNDNYKIYYSEKLEELKEALRQLNYDGCYAKISPPEIERTGLYCAVTVIPELQPMHIDESLPYFSGQRLKEIPLKLGYQPAEKINIEPHPFP